MSYDINFWFRKPGQTFDDWAESFDGTYPPDEQQRLAIALPDVRTHIPIMLREAEVRDEAGGIAIDDDESAISFGFSPRGVSLSCPYRIGTGSSRIPLVYDIAETVASLTGLQPWNPQICAAIARSNLDVAIVAYERVCRIGASLPSRPGGDPPELTPSKPNRWDRWRTLLTGQAPSPESHTNSSISGKPTDFTRYEIYDSGIRASGPPSRWSRADAEQDFDYFVGNLDTRIAVLNSLTTRNHGPGLDFTDESVAALNEWFVDRAEPEPDQKTWPGGLTPDWYSVVGDMKAYLSEILRRRKPHLRWELSARNKRDASYHRPVITGFTNVPSQTYAVEYGQIVAILGIRVARHDLREDSRQILLNVLRADIDNA